MHWTQTKEGREKISARMRAFYKTPAGQRVAKKRAKGSKALAALAARNGHDAAASRAASGRAMLTGLAIVGAETRIAELRRELEKLTVFLDHARGKAK